MPTCLVLHSSDISAAEKELFPRLASALCLLRFPEDIAFVDRFEHCLVWLNDENLRSFLKAQIHAEVTLHLLPHKQGGNGQRGYCTEASLSATQWQLEERPVKKLDVLRCNGEVVLNKLVVGRAFSFQPGGHSRNPWQRLKTVWHQLRHLRDYIPCAFRLTTGNDAQLKTAAVGVVCSPHALRSNLSRKLLPENYANDGMLYSLVVAPKSLLEMLRYFLVSAFVKSLPQPGFLGVLRSRTLVIESNGNLDCRLDGVPFQAESLNLTIEEGALTLGLEPNSPLLDSGVRHKEIRRLKNLNSSAESIKGMVGKPLPFITHAGTEDFKELYLQLRENAQASSSFLTLMVLSTLMASFGLYADSSPVIIGAMILAPLMGPIISLAMAFARQDAALMISSFRTLGIGFLLAVGCAMALSFLLPLQIETGEIAARLRPTLLDLGIAIISGVASAYAYSRAQAAKGLAGVAIAVALVPPLAVTGIGLGWFSGRIAAGALLLFLTNLAGIVFSASATFLLLGFAPFTRARQGLIIALVTVALVAMPLAISFRQLAREGAIVQALEQYTFDEVSLRQVKVRSVKTPVQLSFELVTRQNPSDVNLQMIKQAIEREIGHEVELEVQWVIRY